MKETNRETVRRLREQGLTVWEIVRLTGMNPNTAGTYYREWNRLDPAGCPKAGLGAGMNADRHLCRSCQFRARKEAVNGCDYCWITGKCRRCKVADCDQGWQDRERQVALRY